MVPNEIFLLPVRVCGGAATSLLLYYLISPATGHHFRPASLIWTSLWQRFSLIIFINPVLIAVET
jgi:hypothetical protein